MLSRLHDLAEHRKTFAFESTLAAKHYAGWIKKLRKQGYAFQLMFLWLRSADLAVQRVRERVQVGGTCPNKSCGEGTPRGVRNFSSLYQPLADTWAVYDNSNLPDPMIIAQGGQGEEQNIFHADLWRDFRKMSQ